MMVPLAVAVAWPLRAPSAQLLQLAQYCPPGPFYSNCMFQQQQQERLRELQERQREQQERLRELQEQQREQQMEQLRAQ